MLGPLVEGVGEFGPLPLVEGIGELAVAGSVLRRARTHGFLVRMKTRGGRAVINARRAKGRKKLSQV